MEYKYFFKRYAHPFDDEEVMRHVHTIHFNDQRIDNTLISDRRQFLNWRSLGTNKDWRECMIKCIPIAFKYNRISDRQKQILDMYNEGKGCREIAGILGCSPSNVSRTFRRALDDLEPFLKFADEVYHVFYEHFDL